MKLLRASICAVVLLLGWLALTGCNRSVPPPPPLSAEELPTAFAQGFAKAKPEIKEAANQVVAAVQAKDYTKALFAVQSLAAMPDLSKNQATLTSRGFVTVNELLQAAQAQGDAKAAETIKYYHSTK